MNKNIGINVTILFFTSAIILLSYSLISDFLLKKEGVRTEGTVIYQKINVYPKYYLSNKTISPVVKYTTKNGQDFIITDCEYCHKIGDTVPVIYDPTNPKRAMINTKSLNFNLLYYLIGSIGFLIFFLKIKTTIRS